MNRINLLSSGITRIRIFILAFLFLFAITKGYSQVVVSGSNADGSYANLTGVSGAFAALNSVSQAGKTITVNITANPVEPTSANVALTGAAGIWSSLNISPSGARTVSASVANAPLINLSGVQNVTIDGLNTGGNSLTISNPSTGGAGTSTIQFKNSASNNMVKNCKITGSPNYQTTAIIYFNSSSGGNNNNTITGCDIGAAANNSADYQAIYSDGASSNSANTITNNTIHDFSTYGMYLGAGTGSSWNISGNSFYKTSAYIYTSAWAQNAVYVNNPYIGGFTITGNYIGGTSPQGGSPDTPWDLGTGNGNGFQAVRLYMSSGGPATNLLNNRIQNLKSETTQGGWAFVGILINGGVINIGDGSDANQNVVGSISPNLGISVGNIYFNIISGIDIAADNTNSVILNNNIIANIAYTNSTGVGNANQQLYGILYDATCTPSVRNCKIYNLSNATGFQNDYSTPTLAGIYNWGYASPSGTIVNNEIYNLTTSSAAVIQPIYGISLNTTSVNPPAGVIAGNFIHNIVHGASNSTAYTAGIHIADHGSFTCYNNIVQLGIDTSGNSNTRGSGLYGIMLDGGNGNGNVFYHNSVYIGGSGVASAGNTFCFYRAGQSSGQTMDTLKDNIFFNNRTNGSGSALNLAVADNGIATRLVSSKNDIYTPNGNVASTVANSTTATTISGWMTATGDVGSISAGPMFLNQNGAPPDFHLTAGTPCDAVGTLIPAVATDYYGSVRANYTPVDLGAVVFKANNGSLPVAAFYSADTIFCENSCVTFTDISTNNPTHWRWNFEGGIPATDTIQNPYVCYLAHGNFKVKLVVTNAAGSDSINPDFISVNISPASPFIWQSNDTLFCHSDPSYVSLRWYEGSNTLITAANNDTFLVIDHVGSYNLHVLNTYGCESESGIIILVLNVPDYAGSHQITLSPNPAVNELVIHNLDNLSGELKTISLINALGQIVLEEDIKEKSGLKINTSNLPPGFYFVRAVTGSEIWTGKFVRQ